MKVKVVGFSALRSGEYNGRPYQNRKLSYILVDDKLKPKDYTGQVAGEVKVPSVVSPVVDTLHVGDVVNLTFNRWGQIDDILKG